MSEKLLIASLGIGPYHPSFYNLEDGEPVKTILSFKALAEHFQIPFEQIRVIGTEPDEDHHLRGSEWSYVKESFGRELESHQKVVVPFGLNKLDHYRFFQQLLSLFDGYDEVIIDMTHGYRTFPLIMLMSLFFREAIQEGDTKVRVFYGAYEAGTATSDLVGKNRDGNPIHARRVELVEMQIIPELLDWVKATERFIKYGIVSDLSERTKGLNLPQKIDKDLDVLNKSLAYNHLYVIPDTIRKLENKFRSDRKHIKPDDPLYYLIDPILNLSDQLSDHSQSGSLLKSGAYFFKIKRFGQAAISLREYAIVSLSECIVNKSDEKEKYNHAQRMIGLLTQIHYKDSDDRDKAVSFSELVGKTHKRPVDELSMTCYKLSKIRNNFAHVKRVDARQISGFHKDLENILSNASELFDFSSDPVDEWMDWLQRELPEGDGS